LKQQPDLENLTRSVEGIDFEKLNIVFKKNMLWVILIFLFCNLTGILFLRYTRDLFESESELKLDVKSDATDLGIAVMGDQSTNTVSGEIEQMKSKLFISRLIDSLDLKISYYSSGNVLIDEMYKRSPFIVNQRNIHPSHLNFPIYFEAFDAQQFQLQFGEKGKIVKGFFGKPLNVDGSEFLITKTNSFVENDRNDYFFIINSQEELINYISRNLKVDPLNSSANTIRISFKDHNALKAHDIVNKTDSLYILYSNRQKNLANSQKIEWLNKELNQIEEKIEDFENYFEAFTLQNKSNDLAVDLKTTIVAINKIDSQRYNLNKRILQLNMLIDELQSNKTLNLPYTRSLPESIAKHLEDLQRVTFEQNKLSLAYNENTFAYRQKEQEITSLKDNIFNQLLNVKKEWMTLLGDINKRKEMLEKEFLQMPDKNTQYVKNQRYYKLYEEFYLSMMKSKAEFEIAQAGTTPDFKILSSANLPTSPISPNKKMILAIGFVVGIVTNIFFIGFLYLINNKIISLRELENGTQVAILGTIPISHHSTETIFHVIDNPKSVVSEAIRTLRTNLDFFSSGEPNKVISISSTISGEGKSFLAVNLGGVIALSRKKVVLVDLDMRKPKNDKYPEGSNSNKGMSTILIKKNNWKECLIHTSLENFDFIPSGPHPPNPSELLANEEFTEFLTELKRHYEFIIIDTPPVGLVTDGIMAMKHSDVSIYVFRANYSNIDFMHNLYRIVTLNKLKNVSAVLNAMPVKTNNYGYGYYEDRTPLKKRWKKIFKFS